MESARLRVHLILGHRQEKDRRGAALRQDEDVAAEEDHPGEVHPLRRKADRPGAELRQDGEADADADAAAEKDQPLEDQLPEEPLPEEPLPEELPPKERRKVARPGAEHLQDEDAVAEEDLPAVAPLRRRAYRLDAVLRQDVAVVVDAVEAAEEDLPGQGNRNVQLVLWVHQERRRCKRLLSGITLH